MKNNLALLVVFIAIALIAFFAFQDNFEISSKSSADPELLDYEHDKATELTNLEQLDALNNAGVCICINTGPYESMLSNIERNALMRMEKEAILLSSVSSASASSRNDLKGENVDDLMPILSQCEFLTFFDFDGERANGLLTDEGVKYLSTMHIMDSLQLSAIPVTDKGVAIAVRDMRHLRRLQLINTQVSGEWLHWQFPELETAYFKGSPISDLGLFSMKNGCPNLTTLNLGDTCITNEGLRWLADIESLEAISLDGNDISGGLHHLASLPNLTHLRLRNTAIGDEELGELQNSPKLQSINLANTSITNEGIATLSSLPTIRCLVLHNTNVGKGILSSFRNMPNLEELYLSHSCGMSESDMQELNEQGVYIINIDPHCDGDLER